MNTDHVFNTAFKHHELGDLKKASQGYSEVLRLDPYHVEALHHQGIISLEQGNVHDAIGLIKESLRINLKQPLAHCNLAFALNSVGRYAESYEHCCTALKYDPTIDVYANMGNALRGLGHFFDAKQAYCRALSSTPNDPHLLYNIALIDLDLGNRSKAVEGFKYVLNLMPGLNEARNNLAACLIADGKFIHAKEHLELLLQNAPEDSTAWTNLGEVFSRLGNQTRAGECFVNAFRINPDSEFALGNLIHTKMCTANWRGLSDNVAQLRSAIRSGRPVSLPFNLLAVIDDPWLQRKASEINCLRIREHTVLPEFIRRPHKSKIRVGYFSSDFHNHATAQLMAELPELHDRNRFQIFAFSFGPTTNDYMQTRLKKSFDYFYDLQSLGDAEVIRFARDKGLDIAVDLKGFTQNARSQIFSSRIAPIQINFLGYPGTLGMTSMDYIVADKWLIPEDTRSAYSEKIIYLPDTYQPNDRNKPVAKISATRGHYGLPANSFVYCSFNNHNKITPEMFSLWMRILERVPRSCLWILVWDAAARKNLIKQFSESRLDTKRLIFADRLPLSDHLARLTLADLFLDTFPCNAHTTASDALWSGLPLLTLSGRTFASRVAGSLLLASDLPELITESPDAYQSLAVKMSNSAECLGTLKQRLVSRRDNLALFDTPRYVRNLEKAFQLVFDKYVNGQSPDDINVA